MTTQMKTPKERQDGTSEKKSKSLRLRRTVITANAMNTLYLEDILTALKIAKRNAGGSCNTASSDMESELSMGFDREGHTFWMVIEADTITVMLLEEL